MVALFYPAGVHQFFRARRNYEVSTWPGKMELTPLTFVEAVSVAWIAAVISGIYTIIAFNLGFFDSRLVDMGEQMPAIFGSSSSVIVVVGAVLGIVFFPIAVWIYVKVYELLIRLFVDLFKAPYINHQGVDKLDEAVKQVVNCAISAYLFLLVPVIGEIIASIAFLVLILIGLKVNLRFTTGQSLLVLISPFVLLFLLILTLGGIVSLMMTLV